MESFNNEKILKKEVRVIGFDDGPFEKFNKNKNVLVVGVVFRGGLYFEGVLKTKVRIDGFNSTKKISEAIKRSKFYPQLKAILFDGISLGGFNVIDVEELYKKTGIPILIIMRKIPNFKEIFEAIKHTTKSDLREEIMKKAGSIKRVFVKNSNISGFVYYQKFGCSENYAKRIIQITTTRSLIPEPLRIAHLIASAMIEGESRGRA
ncbi:MAG: DUF99 family protein [Candidatus Woesearchaeota archaeon]